MNIISAGLRKGEVIKSNQGYDMRFSKAKELNCKYRLFFRTKTTDGVTDVIAPAVPGRNADFEVIGTSFIQLDGSQVEIDDNGKLVDKSGLDKWAPITKVLHAASCANKKKVAEIQAQATASATGVDIDVTALDKKFEEIDAEYFGTKVNGVNVAPSIRPILGGLTATFFTQVLVVKMDSKGAPIWKEAKRCTMTLSGKATAALMNACSDPNYHIEGEDWVEIGYDFIGADKKTAGMNAAYQPIATSLSLKNQFPEEWESEGKAAVATLANGDDVDKIAEQMISRAVDLKNSCSVNEVVSKIRKYCATNTAILSSIDMNADATKWYASDILKAGLVDNLPKIKEGLELLVQANDKEEKKDSQSVAEQFDQVATDLATNGNTSTVSQFNTATGGDVDGHTNEGMVDLSEL